MQKTEKAIIIGSSGLIGRELLDQILLCPDFEEVTLLNRSASGLHHPKLKEILVDFNQIEDFAEYIQGTVIFSCLGSTRNKSPDLATYRKIDHDYAINIAQIASKNGAEQFHLISSIGANASSDNFYLKMKGETERDLKKIPFKSIHIYQPSLLDGQRQEFRLLEKLSIHLMRLINPLLIGSLKTYQSIRVTVIASAMIKQAQQNKSGIFTYTSEQIKQLT